MLRWAGAAQNDFPARMQWALTPDLQAAKHPPSVRIVASRRATKVRAGQTVRLPGYGVDPDRALTRYARVILEVT